LQIVLATERGLWRADLSWRRPLRPADFHRDLPAEEIVALVELPPSAGAVEVTGGVEETGAAAPKRPASSIHVDEAVGMAALGRHGAFLVWDGAARAFREAPSLPPREELEWEVLSRRGKEGLTAGGCPAALAHYSFADEAWEMDGAFPPEDAAARWHGLEAPYEPRVTALLPEPHAMWAAVSVGGLLRSEADGWRQLHADGLPRDLRALAWLFDTLWLGSGRGLFACPPAEAATGKATTVSTVHTAKVHPVPLDADASFVGALHSDGRRLVVAAAPGPPATWHGPDGARMSLWSLDAPGERPRRVAGPFSDAITALRRVGTVLLAATVEGRVWRIPLEGGPAEPWIEDLPAIADLMVIDLGTG